MSPQQRMLAAMRGEQVDRLPVATYNCHPFPFGPHGGCREYAPILQAVQRTGAGMLCKVRAGAAGGLPAPRETRTVEAGEEVTVCLLQTPRGPLRQVLRKPPGQPARCVEPYLKTDQDIERFLSIEPTPATWDLSALLAQCEQIGQRGLGYLDYADPFGSTVGLFDQEELLVRLQTDPRPVLDLIERAYERIRDGLARLLDDLARAPAPPGLVFYTAGPEWATPPLMDPRAFARLVSPYQSRLVEMIRRRGFIACLHCHGRVRRALGEVLRCGFDVLEPIEPPPQGDIDLNGLRRTVGQALTLMGYVQDQDLYTATPAQVRDHVAAIVATVGGGSRYIATPTCTPFAFPPPPRYVANYVAFLGAAAKLGA